MSFVKLFGSILRSTVWRTPLHVRVVWIAILAMKDADGIVESSVPGLAHEAGVTREQVDEAIEVLSSPDPDSTTPDYEGRRIEKVDGGWKVLNHQKYRDKESKAERRAKKTARQARWRDASRERKNADLDHDVDAEASTERLQASTVDAGRRVETPIDAGSRERRYTNTNTDLPDTRDMDLPSSPAAARSEPSLDRIQPAPACPVTVAAALVPPPPADVVQANQQRITSFVTLVNAARDRVGAKHGFSDERPLTAAIVGRQGTELLARLRESSNPQADLEHVVAVAEAEAIADVAKMQWLGWSIAEEKSWRTKLAAPPVKRKRARPAELDRAKNANPTPLVVDLPEEERAVFSDWAQSMVKR